MTLEEIIVKVKSIIAETLNVSKDQVTMDAEFTKDLGADSLA